MGILVSISLRVASNLVRKGKDRFKARLVFATLGAVSFELILELGSLFYKVDLYPIDKMILVLFVSTVLYFGSYGVYNIRLKRRIDLLEPVDKKVLSQEIKKNKKDLYIIFSVVFIPLIVILLLEFLK